MEMMSLVSVYRICWICVRDLGGTNRIWGVFRCSLGIRTLIVHVRFLCGMGFVFLGNLDLEQHWRSMGRAALLERLHWKDALGRQHWEEQHWKDRPHLEDRIGNPPSGKGPLGWDYQLSSTRGITLGFLCCIYFAREPTLFPCMS
jgi:hypothetical protein